ncbi:MAG: bifunctional diguanylate cyclase/phosphodiesterase [Pseudomonadota bacterium]
MEKDTTRFQILLVDRGPSEFERIIDWLARDGRYTQGHTVTRFDQIRTALAQQNWDLAIINAHLTELDIGGALKLLNSGSYSVTSLVIGHDLDTHYSAKLMRAGAADVLDASDVERVRFAVRREIAHRSQLRNMTHWRVQHDDCEARFYTLLDSVTYPVAYVHGGMHICANNAYMRLFDIDTLDTLTTLPLLDLIEPAHQRVLRERFNELHYHETPQTLSVRARKYNGPAFEARMVIMPVNYLGEPALQICVHNPNLGGRSVSHDEHDPVTGLYNSQFLLYVLEKMLAGAHSSDELSALCLIEIDAFYQLKSTYGIANGDKILRHVAAILRKTLRNQGLVARFGGDVFAVLIKNNDWDEITRLVTRVHQQIGGLSLTLEDRTLKLSTSIGITPLTSALPNTQAALAAADAARGAAQGAGGNRIHVHGSVTTTQTSAGRDTHGIYLREAITKQWFNLAFMPIVGFRGQTAPRYEVLLRMRGPDNSDIEPTRFMHLASDDDLARIDRWVAAQTVQHWRTAHKEGVKNQFFIKLSAVSAFNPEFVLWVSDILVGSGADPRDFVFQIAERDTLQQLEDCLATTQSLHALGCGVAIEHAGTQDKELRYLNVLPVDYVKIDGSLIRELAKDPQSQGRVHEVVTAVHQAKRQVVAEFVQDASSLAFLWREGVDYIQGYYLQPPSGQLQYEFGNLF